MKKKFLTMLVLSIAITISGCSVGNSDIQTETLAPPGAMYEPSFSTSTKGEYAQDQDMMDKPSGDITQYVDGLKLVYNGYMYLETTDFDAVSESLSLLVTENEGYFSNSSINQYNNNYRSGEYTIRIPAKSYDYFHQSVGQLCLVTRDSTSTEDISAVYYDTEGRLETQQIKLDRLQSLLEQAGNMEDLITIETAISETQWQIDDLSGEMNYYDSIVDYATIDISLVEVYQLSNVQDAPKSFAERMGNSIVDGTSSFTSGLENFAVILAYNWITVIFVVTISFLAIKICPKMRNKRGLKIAITN